MVAAVLPHAMSRCHGVRDVDLVCSCGDKLVFCCCCKSRGIAGHDVGVDVDRRRRRLEALYVEYADAVYAYARRRTDFSVAEDVVMEVFVVVCRRLEDVPQQPLPWLLACARRVLANQRRSAARTEALSERLRRAGQAAGIDDGAAERLGSALEQLRDGDREIMLLSAWEGLDLSGLALTLGCSRSAAAVRLHRARRRLRLALEREGPATADSQTVEVTR